ncbi:alanine racemase [Chytriomyces confervae]|uniref:Pyridoxal phosphate homeostasis protein n=1 Tax=Chytriomyces confervae TaxID=246404 RepID=A0A507FLH2_9FUNG|nr:alanine racemase [Chytriomyces confervae]
MSAIAANLAECRARVAAAATAAARAPEQVRLVAVSKTKPVEDLMVAYNEGQRHFGENLAHTSTLYRLHPPLPLLYRMSQVQELVDKAAQMPSDIQWHFIGTLQSNKCKLVAVIPNLFAVETVDGIKKADTLHKALVQAQRATPLNVFVQLNTSGEESKGGILPTETLQVATHILEKCPTLKLAGLMTIGSPGRDATGGPNPDFKCLSDCRDLIKAAHGIDLELSMGMSDDFEHAIEMGSTNVRVGSVIFGARAGKV